MSEESFISSVEKNRYVMLEGEDAQCVHANIVAERYGLLLPQDKNGTKIYDVKRDINVENTASSKGSLIIAPHTDGALIENPPKIVALFGKNVPGNEKCTKSHTCPFSILAYSPLSNYQS